MRRRLFTATKPALRPGPRRPGGRFVRSVMLVVAPAVIGIVACGKPQQPQGGGMSAPAVSVAEVLIQNITPWDEFSGRIEAEETVEIRPRVAGVIDAVRYREGEDVKKGEVLFVIDQRSFRAELERAQAAVARAEAQVVLAKGERARARKLFDSKVFSKQDYDQRVAAETQAEADVHAAKAAVRLASLNLEYTEVRAPIGGRTGRALVTKGNLVSSDPTPDLLTTLVSIDPVYVYFDVDEQTYLGYEARSAAAIRQTAEGKRRALIGLSDNEGYPYTGTVDFIDNQLDPATGTIRMRAVIANSDHTLIPGLFARVKLLGTADRSTMLVDDRAILTDQDRKYVYVLGPENRAMRRNIRIGHVVGGLRIVEDGLNAGDKIIVYGLQKIFFPGMPVNPQPIHMGDPEPAPGPGGPGAPGAGH
jgi:multidrug efflux system membrane fusion protein